MAERDLERDPKTVPGNVRSEVIDRDHSCCRVCGRHVEHPALHHLVFRSQGGPNTAENLVVVGWQPGHDCHLTYCHGPEAALWRRLLQQAILIPGTTAFALRRQATMAGIRKPLPFTEVVERFWSRVDQSGGPDACWPWLGSLNPKGYPQLSAKGIKQTPVLGHRFAFYLAHGHWPRPACLHSCDNPVCCNPAHLREGTQQDNMEDRRQRNPRYGERNPNAKHGHLVDEIRTRVASGETQADVARSLHLNSGVVSRIVRGVNYPDSP